MENEFKKIDFRTESSEFAVKIPLWKVFNNRNNNNNKENWINLKHTVWKSHSFYVNIYISKLKSFNYTKYRALVERCWECLEALEAIIFLSHIRTEHEKRSFLYHYSKESEASETLLIQV